MARADWPVGVCPRAKFKFFPRAFSLVNRRPAADRHWGRLLGDSLARPRAHIYSSRTLPSAAAAEATSPAPLAAFIPSDRLDTHPIHSCEQRYRRLCPRCSPRRWASMNPNDMMSPVRKKLPRADASGTPARVRRSRMAACTHRLWRLTWHVCFVWPNDVGRSRRSGVFISPARTGPRPQLR